MARANCRLVQISLPLEHSKMPALVYEGRFWFMLWKFGIYTTIQKDYVEIWNKGDGVEYISLVWGNILNVNYYSHHSKLFWDIGVK